MSRGRMSEAAEGTPGWPVMSIAQAHARMTAPGALFEMETLCLDGRPTRAWKNGPKSLVEMWSATAPYAARTFIVQDDRRITYDAFRRAAMVLAKALIDGGVRKGDRVAIVMRNQAEWVVAFYAATLAGAIATPLNAWWSANELIVALKQSCASVALFDEERYRRVALLLKDCEPGPRQCFVSHWTGALPDTAIALEAVIGPPGAWADLPEAGAPPVAILPEDDATLFYTSGTEGVPKGALATHRAATTPVFVGLFSQARAHVRRGETPPQAGPDAPQKRFLLAIPLFHVTGCFSLLNAAMAGGGMIVMVRKWEPEIAMQLIARERITNIGGVPTIPWQLLAHPARELYDLSSVNTITYGGAPAAPELVRQLGAAFPQAQPGCGWGMTETCAAFTHHFGEDYVQRPDSCGPSAPVGDMKIVDRAGATLPVGAIGELWVRGPHVARGYWEMPEATAATFADGWLKTGDLARLDDEGFCFIVDRAKDVIIRGGENIYSVEVEDVLYRHPAIMDAALVPILHATLGEEAGAVVCLKPGAKADADEIKRFVGEYLAAFKVPAQVILRSEPLPRNANGKIMKSGLRALFGDGAPSSVTART